MSQALAKAMFRGAWQTAKEIEPKLASYRKPRLDFYQRRRPASRMGTAFWSFDRVLLSPNPEWTEDHWVWVVLHETAHLVSFARGELGHGDIFRAAMAELCHEHGLIPPRTTRYEPLKKPE